MHTKGVILWVMVTLAYLVLTVGAIAQSLGTAAGTIHGVVSAPTGAVVPDASVEIHDPVTGYRQTFSTDPAGEFRFLNLPLNPYHLKVTKGGFQTYERDVNARSSVPVDLKIELQLPTAMAIATVEAPAADPLGPSLDDVLLQLKVLQERVRQLESEVQTLKAAQVRPAPPPTPSQAPTTVTAAASTVQVPAGAPGTPSGPLPVYGGASALAKVLNPDISVIGDFLGAAGHNPTRRVPTLEVHESEVGLQAIVDPYARADFFLSFGERDVDLEEGYITFTSLPAGVVAKVGKMRSSFGVVNTLHNHNLPWTDRPLVTENLVGGEDGITDAGLSVTRLIPAPKGIYLEGTGQVFRGDSANVFTATRKGDVSVVGRLRGYRDLTESTNLDIGFSYARGHNDLGTAFRTQLFGADATLRWKPLRRSIYHSFLFRNEFVWSRRNQLPVTRTAFGLYSAAEYRLNRRWTVGGRYDRSGRARDATLTDSGLSALLTYWPSEFSQIRGQYRFTRDPFGRDGNELLFQFQFSLGAHGAHPF